VLPMDNTMLDLSLTVTGILRYGASWHADRTVITATADGYREIGFGPLGERVAQLGHGLCSIGVTGDQRVATFKWDNQEHLEAYLAIPCMRTVLHTLNIRLAGTIWRCQLH
jgi:fatty-acyl-CoA synthase